MKKKIKREDNSTLSKTGVQIAVIFLIVLSVIIIFAYTKPTITANATLLLEFIKNETRNITGAAMENTTSPGGGFINVINISVFQQTAKWKAYVGNMSGTLELKDAGGAKFYEWFILTSITGRVYAVRNSSAPNWAGINCTWAFLANGSASTDVNNHNITESENQALSHTSPADNITATFNKINHTSFWVGSIQIPVNYCWNTNPFIANVSQNDTIYADTFDEVILYDNYAGIIYSGEIEIDQPGYGSQSASETTYDFQMLLPENGDPRFASSTAYYFYVEVN